MTPDQTADVAAEDLGRPREIESEGLAPSPAQEHQPQHQDQPA